METEIMKHLLQQAAEIAELRREIDALKAKKPPTKSRMHYVPDGTFETMRKSCPTLARYLLGSIDLDGSLWRATEDDLVQKQMIRLRQLGTKGVTDYKTRAAIRSSFHSLPATAERHGFKLTVNKDDPKNPVYKISKKKTS